MSSLGVALANIGASGFFHSATSALMSLSGRANAKALGGSHFEGVSYRRVVHDEALEPFWQTLFSSIAVKTAEYLTPRVPQQLVMLPTQMLGSLFHWYITSPQSVNYSTSNGNKKGSFKKFVEKAHDVLVKRPTEWTLNKLGLKEKKDESSYLRYGLIQAGIFGLAAFAQRKSNISMPGVNISPDDSKLVTFLKTIGFTLVDQATYMFSQTMRYWTDFREEFGESAFAKAAACVANERAMPGHILSSIFSCLSTYSLGRFIPKAAAAEIGRFPFDYLNRMFNCHRRRATNYKLSEDGKVIPGWRLSSSKAFNGFLKFCDAIFKYPRKWFLDIVVWTFGGGKDKVKFREELISAQQPILKLAYDKQMKLLAQAASP